MSHDEDPLPAAALIVPRAGIEYLPHQEEGVRWMMAREADGAAVCRGGILADDMGLGKTFQTIGLMRNGLPLRTLIVCPPALIAGWTEELRACGFSVRSLTSAASWTPAAAGEEERVAVYLTTYPKATLYRRCLCAEAFGRVVLDEGHVIRNGKDTARWTAAMSYANRAQTRWILSATPVQNSYSDWRNLTMWLRVRCSNSAVPEIGPTIMLRRTMEELRDVIDALPAPPRYIAHDLSVPAGSAEEKLFRALCDQLQNVIDSHAVSALMKLELYLRIQQFLVHPQIYVESMRRKFRGAYPRPDWAGTATKWSACAAEMARGVEARAGQIVFCMFRTEMDRVAEEAGRLGAEVFCVRGGMAAEKVGEAVTGARTAAGEGKAVVVVVQIVAGGAGLNLQFCTRVLFLSQHWNPAVVHQAVGRAVRIGQKAVVEVHLFRVVDDVMDNLDRRMVQIHLRKIAGAREICSSLYAGFAPLREESFPSARPAESDSVEGDDPADDDDSMLGTEAVVGGAAVDARW